MSSVPFGCKEKEWPNLTLCDEKAETHNKEEGSQHQEYLCLLLPTTFERRRRCWDHPGAHYMALCRREKGGQKPATFLNRIGKLAKRHFCVEPSQKLPVSATLPSVFLTQSPTQTHTTKPNTQQGDFTSWSFPLFNPLSLCLFYIVAFHRIIHFNI
jgi:hypothetical protein